MTVPRSIKQQMTNIQSLSAEIEKALDTQAPEDTEIWDYISPSQLKSASYSACNLLCAVSEIVYRLSKQSTERLCQPPQECSPPSDLTAFKQELGEIRRQVMELERLANCGTVTRR